MNHMKLTKGLGGIGEWPPISTYVTKSLYTKYDTIINTNVPFPSTQLGNLNSMHD